MKAQLNRQELAEALAAVASVAAARTPKPILQCVFIDLREDHGVLAATDLEIGIRFTVSQVEVGEPGQVVLPADKLSQIVRESSDDVIELESDDSVCHVRGRGSHFQIYMRDAADFPPVAELDGEPDFELDAAGLRRMAEWTVFATARENTRYAINGVKWDKDEKQLIMVGTDGRRLSFARTALDTHGGEKSSAIVPVKAMSILQRIIGEGDTVVQVKFTGNQMVARTVRATVSTGLVEGLFPNYPEVIPNDCNRKIPLQTVDLLSALRRAALLTNEESKGVRLTFTDGKLTLMSRAPSEGESMIEVPVDYHDEQLEVGFNPHFLIEALKNAHVDEVQLELKDAKRAGILRLSPDYLYVIMPVNLS